MSELERLQAVQNMDLEIDRLKFEEESIPGDLANARSEKIRLEREIAKNMENLAQLRRQVNEADLELRDLGAKRDRAKEDQKSSGSAKEQTQYENMIQQLSGRIEEIENDSLPVVEKQEAADGVVKNLQNELEALLPKLTDLEGIDEERIKELKQTHHDKLQNRNSQASSIDAKLLREYDNIRRAKKGVGLVTTKGPKCGGCNVQLPMNVQQRVASDVVGVKCPSCGRLLRQGTE